ncbi:hypothetical protein BH24ACT15_BH24ACT15_33470 [soil metagenome]
MSGHSGVEVEVSARLGDLHRLHAWLDAPEDVDPLLLRELAVALVEAAGVPLAVKAVPGTPRHAQLVAAGATAYQVVPPSLVDCTDPANAAWAASAETHPPALTNLVDVAPEVVLDLWLRIYTWVHADWSPVHDPERAREIFDVLLHDLDPARSLLATRDGEPTAVAFAFREDETLGVVCEAVDPAAPAARSDVTSCLRAVVDGARKAGWPAVLFDGHVTDRHFYPALQEIPHRSGQGLHLLHVGLAE